MCKRTAQHSTQAGSPAVNTPRSCFESQRYSFCLFISSFQAFMGGNCSNFTFNIPRWKVFLSSRPLNFNRKQNILKLKFNSACWFNGYVCPPWALFKPQSPEELSNIRGLKWNKILSPLWHDIHRKMVDYPPSLQTLINTIYSICSKTILGNKAQWALSKYLISPTPAQILSELYF